MWQEVSVTGGVVRRREAQALRPGEYVRATNCRLKPNDLTQLHNDVGTATFGTPNNTIVAGPFVLRFESAIDRLMVVTTDNTDSYIEIAQLGASGAFSSIQTISGVVTGADVVHRGDEYFVGTDQGNYVVKGGGVVRTMGLDKQTGNSVDIVTRLASGATNSCKANDRFVYFFTEYDSTNDVESELEYGDFGTAIADGDEFRVNFNSSLVNRTDNTNADKVRIYRVFCGNGALGSDANSIQLDYSFVNSEPISQAQLALFGSLVAELDNDYEDTTYGAGFWVDELLGKFGGGPQYPLVQTDAAVGGAIYRLLVKTRSFTLGELYNDCLVVNDPDESAQVLRYSPPGYPEYQPNPYFAFFTTDDSDAVVGLHEVNNRLLVLTRGAVHRVNYLPTAGDIRAEQGRVKELVTSRAGCVGRNASAKVQTENGELVVWVSSRGLEWSNGLGWSDACPDFTADDINAGDVVLVNNEKLYRLELYSAAQRWDFYYHPSLIKEGRLRLMGPSAGPASSLVGGCGTRDYVYVASSSTVYAVNVGVNSTDTVLESGHLRGPGPLNDLEMQGYALAHGATAGSRYTVVAYGKQLGVSEAQTPEYTIPDTDQEEVGKAEFSMNGKHLRTKLTVDSSLAWSAGPAWLWIRVTEGG